MALQPAATIQLEVYEDAVRFCGIASVTLPAVNYITSTVSGVGMMGNVEIPVAGMVDSMSLTINWLETNGDVARLLNSGKHQLELRVATEKWDNEQADIKIQADKYVVLVRAKSFSPGNLAPMGTADTTSEYACYYFAAFKDGKKLWEIDKRNQICEVNGVDDFKSIKDALGL